MDSNNCDSKLAQDCRANPLRKELRNLTSLSKNERIQFMDSFDTVFCDCDGVLWQTMRDAIPGSAKAINYLQSLGKKVVFVTNNSINSIDKQLKKFQDSDIVVNKEDIIHPAQSICDYLKDINFEGLIFCIASLSFKNHLKDEGFQIVEGTDRIISDSISDLRDAIFSRDPVNAIVIDVDFNLNISKLIRAHLHLKNPECFLVAGAADSVIPFGGGDIIGPGAFINILEQTANRKAIVLGKPGKDLCEMLKHRYNIVDPNRALFVGDSPTSDVKFGKLCGFQTLLVLTGGISYQDLNKYTKDDETADFYVNQLADLNNFV